MKTVLFRLSADHGHFKKPWTSNSPQTYLVPPKPAMLGMCAAMAGINRDVFKNELEQYCKGLSYGLMLRSPLKKKVISTHQLNLDNFHASKLGKKESPITSPKPSEYIVEFDADVVIILNDDRNAEAKRLFDDLLEAMTSGCYAFEPTMGHVNCFASAEFIQEGVSSRGSGAFQTNGFTLSPPKNDIDVLVEKLPIMRKAGMPFFDIMHKDVYLSEMGGMLSSEGEHVRFNDVDFCVV